MLLFAPAKEPSPTGLEGSSNGASSVSPSPPSARVFPLSRELTGMPNSSSSPSRSLVGTGGDDAAKSCVIGGTGGSGRVEWGTSGGAPGAGPAVDGRGGGETVGGPRALLFLSLGLDKLDMDFLCWGGFVAVDSAGGSGNGGGEDGGSGCGAREDARAGGNSTTDWWGPAEADADPVTDTNDEEADPGDGLSYPFTPSARSGLTVRPPVDFGRVPAEMVLDARGESKGSDGRRFLS